MPKLQPRVDEFDAAAVVGARAARTQIDEGPRHGGATGLSTFIRRIAQEPAFQTLLPRLTSISRLSGSSSMRVTRLGRSYSRT